ncbi:MAG: protein kinase, partial [Elusimicrobiota bacterium]|nr:protein kinase [Elusimicrobiota bacterium]
LGVGDPRGALAPLDAALGADPLLSDAYMHRALAWSAIGELAKALIDVTKAIELWTARGDGALAADGLALRAQLRGRGGDRAGALADADRAVGLAPEKAGGYAERAKALEALGEKAEKVLADFKRAAELDPANYSASYQDAIARYGKDDIGAAPPAAPWLDRTILGAAAFFVLLAGLVGWLLVRKPAAAPTTGRQVRRLDSQYDLGEVIGEGGMGAVYKGFDRTLKRPVAVKRLRSELQNNPRERERFLKEAEMVASLHHPHIVDIYTIIQDGEQTYLVFEFVQGKTVHDLLNESPGRRLTPARALPLLKQACDAVDHAHSRHVIHRDLKPSNVMIADGGWVKVMDFGIARQVKDSLLVTTNTIVGTPTYMAPEQAMGQVVKESDVYALGATLYEMLTGAVPFRGSGELQDKLDARFVAASVLVPDLGQAIDAVLRKALDPRPEARYRSAEAFYRAAAEALNGRVTPVA